LDQSGSTRQIETKVITLKRVVFAILVPILFIGCDFFSRVPEDIIVARVKDNYLYKDEIKDLVPVGLSPEDSAVIVKAYINRWARQHLLMDGAQRNLSDEQQQEFEVLVDQYRNELFSKAYMDGLVIQSLDTLVTEMEAQEFYIANRESFKLNENIIKLRYINIQQSALNLDEVKERFVRFDSIDKPYLDSIALQFNTFSLKDSIWVSAQQVADKIPVINTTNQSELLKISNFLQLKDSINLYLIKVEDVRYRNDYAPLQYMLPSINQMVLNKRKLELTKQLEMDIIKDAIRTKEFETYE
jgi:hypothetical protein